MKTVHIDIGLRKAFSTPGGNGRAGISYSNLPYPAEALPSDGLLRYFPRKIGGNAFDTVAEILQDFAAAWAGGREIKQLMRI